MLRRKEASIGKIQQKKKGNERHVERKEQNYGKQRPYHSVIVEWCDEKTTRLCE